VATDESTPPEPEPRTACHWILVLPVVVGFVLWLGGL
jgi:hypothetical protein